MLEYIDKGLKKSVYLKKKQIFLNDSLFDGMEKLTAISNNYHWNLVDNKYIIIFNFFLILFVFFLADRLIFIVFLLVKAFSMDESAFDPVLEHDRYPNGKYSIHDTAKRWICENTSRVVAIL